MRIVVAGLGALLLLSACAQQQQQQAAQNDPRQGPNGARYDRDREACRSVVDDYLRRRRNIDDSRSQVFQGERDRFGQGALPETMAAYGDNRSADRLIANCMESRGWPQAQPKSWWQRIGS